MKKAIFSLVFFILYLFSFSQDYTGNKNKSLFIFISPISLSRVSNMEFSEVKRSQYDKTYEVRSTPLILYMSSLKGYDYNFTIPSSFVVKANEGKNEIVIKIKKVGLETGVLGETGKEIFKVGGSYIMTPKTAAGVYQKAFEIRVNFP